MTTDPELLLMMACNGQLSGLKTFLVKAWLFLSLQIPASQPHASYLREWLSIAWCIAI